MYCADPKDWTINLDKQGLARGGYRYVYVEYTFELDRNLPIEYAQNAF